MFLRLAGVLALCMVALAGCDDPTTLSLDGGAPDAAPPSGSGRVVIESATSLALGPTERADFVARWLDADGRPVAMRDVSFALEGMPRDSTLFSLGARTDAEGRVNGVVIAGRETATFRVRVAAPGAMPAYVDVAVSTSGFGRLLAFVEGGAGRDIVQRTVLLHQSTSIPVSCADALTRSEADRSRTTDASGVAEFATLPAMQRFTVVARAISAASVIVAEGCVEDVVIAADSDTRATITLLPRMLGIEGEYDTEVALRGGSSPRTAADTVLAATSAAIDARGGDAAFLLDALEGELEGRTASDALAALRVLRASGDAEDQLGARLASEGARPTAALRGLIDEIVALHRSITVEGVLFVAGSMSGPVASFTRGDVVLTADAGSSVMIDLAAQGVPARAPTAVRWNDASDELAVEALRIELPIGRSMLAAVDALAVQRGFDRAVELLVERGGCDSLASWVAADAELAMACDEACAASACRAALQSGLDVLSTTASALDLVRARLVLNGALRTEDGDGNLSVDALRADALMGAWRSADETTFEPVEASFGGARISPLP